MLTPAALHSSPTYRPLQRLFLATATAALLSTGITTHAAEWDVEWSCPAGYQVKEGLNTDFPHKGMSRAFVVHAPSNTSGPLPVWVPLTGSVESTTANLTVARSGANSLMAEQGFMVIGPVRACANQDPDFGGSPESCNRAGSNGWNWDPWFEGRAANAEGEQWKNEAGPDASFLQAIVQCAGTEWELDSRRLFLGGISSGGTMTNRALTFRSDFWAGGLPISGEWYVTQDDGTPLSFNDSRQAVINSPTKIHQGRVAPFPLKDELDPLIVITVWGGENDLWNCGSGENRFLCADYRPSTQAGSNYFSSLVNVVHVACTATHGHMWPQVNTQAFNLWALRTLASHPKGSELSDFRLTEPPEGYQCQLGPFTDLYSPEIELTNLLHEFMDGASRNDAAVHDRFWAEDLIYTSSAGLRFGKAQIMGDLRAAPDTPSDTRYTAQEIQIQVYGETAIVAFHMTGVTSTASDSSTANFFNSGTFVKRNGQWQVVNWQATRIPDQPLL